MIINKIPIEIKEVTGDLSNLKRKHNFLKKLIKRINNDFQNNKFYEYCSCEVPYSGAEQLQTDLRFITGLCFNVEFNGDGSVVIKKKQNYYV